MPFNFRFQHLCGAVYSRGNVAFTSDGNTLLSPVGNRVTAFDLVQHTSATLPFEARTTIRAMALSHDSRLLLVVDEDGHSVLLNFRRRIVLHRFNFKQRVRAHGSQCALGVPRAAALPQPRRHRQQLELVFACLTRRGKRLGAQSEYLA